MGLAPRQWAFLLSFYTIYLMFGACVFYYIEHNAETERRAKDLQSRIEINELLVSFTSPDDVQKQKDMLNRVSSYCNKPVTDYKEDEFVNPYQWTFYHAVFFSFIVCSTLGYGNITPSGTVGRYFMIAYALIGMPVNMILYTYLGEYFGSKFIKIYRKYKAFEQSRHPEILYMPHRWSMIIKITLSLLLPALVILVFLPSMLFTYFEGWDYSISVYYSFVTLLTIGFGDFVPTFQPHQERTFGIYFVFYEIFVLVWFVFGLSYILMLIGFIARGMQSKKISRFEKQLTENIKLTHNRIWGGVSKDVGYLRRILNEIYIMRVRPVFAEPNYAQISCKLNRSQSCPELTIFSCKSPVPMRKRALSEQWVDDDKVDIDPRSLQLQTRHSESNLMRIDRQKTFRQQSILENTGDVLAQVVFALNSFNSGADEKEMSQSGGIDLFTDESILEDEWSIITTPSDHQKPPKNLRSRAKSMHMHRAKASVSTTPQFTWSGDNDDIQTYINAQARSNKKITEKVKKDTNGVVISIDKPKDVESNGSRRKSVFNVFNSVFKRRNTLFIDDGKHESEPPYKTKVSPAMERKDLRKPQFNLESIRRPSILSNHSASSEQVLENTTIADLIRAIENAHVKNMLGAKAMEMNRRTSLAHSLVRRSSAAFSTHLETPPSAGSYRLNALKPSMAVPRNRLLTMRQNSSPNRFSVTPVLDSPSSAVSLSPIIQRRMRRFSASPSTTMMPARKLSTSLQTTPLALRRTQFKQTISPLAKPPTEIQSGNNPKASMLSKNLTKALDQLDKN